MDCGEMVSVSMGEMPVAPPCTPSPQPGDRTYQKEEDDMQQMSTICADGMTVLGVPGAPAKNAQIAAQMPAQAYPQYYAPFYQYTAVPNAATPHYGPTVMYTVPMQYYQQMRQSGHATYPIEYASTMPAQQQQQQQQQPQQMQQQPPQHSVQHHGKSHVEPPTIVKTPSRQRVVIWNYCQFCQNNREPEDFYRGHILRDAEGKVVCPILRAYNCPICNNGGGDKAHTKSYCPQLRPTNRLPRRSTLGF